MKRHDEPATGRHGQYLNRESRNFRVFPSLSYLSGCRSIVRDTPPREPLLSALKGCFYCKNNESNRISPIRVSLLKGLLLHYPRDSSSEDGSFQRSRQPPFVAKTRGRNMAENLSTCLFALLAQHLYIGHSRMLSLARPSAGKSPQNLYN
jgi:hypothetical protein